VPRAATVASARAAAPSAAAGRSGYVALTRVPRALAILSWTLVGAALLGALERRVWLGALIGELGLHLALVGLITALVALARRALLVAAGLLVLVAWFGWPLTGFMRATRPTPQAGPILRVATAHLAGAPLDARALASFLARERPDALALTGVVDAPPLADALESYTVVRERGADEPSQLLIVQAALAVPGRGRASPRPHVAVRAGRCQAQLATLSLPTITAHGELPAREQAIAALARAEPPARSIWLGHLGSRAEAHDLTPLLQKHGLRDARLGHGRLATTPAALGPLGFPRSDVLVQGWISVRSMTAEPPLVAGADRTLLAVLELTEPRCRSERAAPTE